MLQKLKPETLRKWDGRYSRLARRVSTWSKDPRAKVGAVLLNRHGWPIALGYNGFPVDIEDDVEALADSDLKNKMVIHAEQNALLSAGARARKGTLYVYGKPVCPRCAVLIIQAGVKRVVAEKPDPKQNPDSDTHRDGGLSVKMFKEANVEFVRVDDQYFRSRAKRKRQASKD